MVTKIVAIYIFFDDILKSMEYKEPINRKTTDAQIATAILIAARYFEGNIKTTIGFMCSIGLIFTMLCKSRFNRRIHKTGKLLVGLFFYLGQAIKEMNISQTYCINSFPVAVCQNIRIPRCRIVQGKMYRGNCVSKWTYFYGFKVHVIITSEGIPIEYTFTTENVHDLDGVKQLPLNLPKESEILADSAYTNYTTEVMMLNEGIRLITARKSDSKQHHNRCTQYLISIGRKRIETAFSDIAKYVPKKIHTVTENGFVVKLIAFIWAYMFEKIYEL